MLMSEDNLATDYFLGKLVPSSSQGRDSTYLRRRPQQVKEEKG